MINTDYFRNKKITIVGLARSGLACANLLSDLGSQVSITDNNDTEATRANLEKLKSKKIKSELGRHTPEFVKGQDLLVVSPGVPDTALAVKWAEEFKVPAVSEIEIAAFLCPATIIAVTGTNGKTTVTTLIGRVLEKKGERAIVCGNIGNPFSGEVSKLREKDFVCLEVSSFQLEKIRGFKPKISVILNFSRNHLDRYKDMREYLEAKKRIFMNQDKEDYLVLNYQDPLAKELSGQARARTFYFSKDGDFNPNQAAVLAVASILGIDRELVLRVFKEFKGIEHRLEEVAEVNKVKFINDSKATTVDSAIWALENMPGPVILIAGGKDKGCDYGAISALIKKKVKEIILIGEAKEKIKKSLSGCSRLSEAPSLEEAVGLAFLKSQPGDCVLLSPMCASFDMFSNYEERGRVFKQAVNLIKSQIPNHKQITIPNDQIPKLII